MDRPALYGAGAAINARRQIRLVELQPGNYDDLTVTCRIYPSEVSGSNFGALSYTWGASSASKTISLNKLTDFAVTDNLYAALKRLRDPERTRTLWIDAICIDQDNLDERSQQVKLMGAIYRQAESVVVWLGDAAEPEAVDSSPFRPSLPVTTAFTSSVPTEIEDWKMRSLNSALAGTSPQWWKRTWIIQEAVLANRLRAQFGPFQCSWTELGLLREKMSAMIEISRSRIYTDELAAMMSSSQSPGTFEYHMRQYRLIDFDDGFQALETLRTHKDTWAGLSEIASVTAQSAATDLKDRVYGYLGLWSGQNDELMQIDYRQSLAKVFASATLADMKSENNLRVLILVRPADRKIKDLQSWALDFTFGGFPDETPAYPMAVVASESRQLPLDLRLDNGREKLTVLGHSIDSVKEVYALPQSLVFPSSEEQHLLTTVLKSVPNCDAYGLLASQPDNSHSLTNRINDKLSILPPSAHSLAQQLGIQTDPISNVFLWWLSETAQPIPRKSEFSEIYEWWRTYCRYQSWPSSSMQETSREVFFVTEKGFIGLGLPSMQPGDTVALLQGLEIPAVLGAVNDAYTFKGLAWVNGIMMGELRDVLINVPLQNIRLV